MKQRNIIKKTRYKYYVEQEALKHVEFIAVPTSEFDNNILKLIEIQKQLGYVKNNLTLDQVLNMNFLPINQY